MTWVLDLDGVVWRGNQPIEGSVEAIRKLKDAGIRVTYVTNNSTQGAAEQVQKMATMGIETDLDDVLSAQDLLIQHLGEKQTIMCPGAPRLVQALRDAGHTVLVPEDYIGDGNNPESVGHPDPVDLVVAGQRFDATYLQYSVAMRSVLQCGRLVAANRDPMYPHSTGMFIGTGSVVAMLEEASGVKAHVIGKPEQTMVDEVHKRIPDASLVVGDQFSTDGELARKANIPFAFVESGVDATRTTDGGGTPVAHRMANLAALVEALV